MNRKYTKLIITQQKTWLSTLPCRLEVAFTVIPKFLPPTNPPSKKTNCFPTVATCKFSSEFKREPPYICAGLIRGLLRTMVINHPLNKVQDFPGGGWVFVGKRLWICMMNTNHLEGRVCSTDYVGIDTYLSCWILWATLRELFRTYPASSRNRKMIFQKGGDILVPGRVVLNQATRSLKWRQLKAQNWKEKNPPLNYTTWKVDGDHQETSASVKVHEATRLVDTCTTTTNTMNTRCQQLPGDRMTKDFKPSMIWEITQNETRDWYIYLSLPPGN